MNVQIDRSAIARYGLSMADVQDVVSIAVGGREAGQVFEGDRRFDLVVRLPDNVRRNMSALENLPIPLPEGSENGGAEKLASAGLSPPSGRQGFIPLSSVAKIEVTEGPNQISRENGKRRIVVQTNVRGRDIGSFVADAQGRINQQVKVAAGNWLDWGGQFENLVAARRRLTIVVPICFFLIFMLLFTALDSVKHALLVFTGVPLALTGGIIACGCGTCRSRSRRRSASSPCRAWPC
jgi:cobalt-zinc-cadmium resistance protein CzcA